MCGGNAGPVMDALEVVLSHLEDVREGLESDDPIAAVRRWAADVRGRTFPSTEEGYGIPAEVLAAVKGRLPDRSRRERD